MVADLSAEPASRPALRRELRFTETAAVSVGVMAPTLAMSVTGVAAAGELGRAAPLAFAVAALGVGLVAYGFVRLAGIRYCFQPGGGTMDGFVLGMIVGIGITLAFVIYDEGEYFLRLHQGIKRTMQRYKTTDR